ncbi:MAG: hypothetical protein O2856_16570, partial [Planctomycetota bacterium]|nr:hypothetical protein [Planctomycetota bacterium]
MKFPINKTLYWIVVLFVATPLCAMADDTVANSRPVDFAREILPILSDKCFICHGPDSHAQVEAGTELLRLDSFAGATHDLGGYRAIDTEAPDKSEILSRIHSTDAPMPPP